MPGTWPWPAGVVMGVLAQFALMLLIVWDHMSDAKKEFHRSPIMRHIPVKYRKMARTMAIMPQLAIIPEPPELPKLTVNAIYFT